jgi:hypothetical protein
MLAPLVEVEIIAPPGQAVFIANVQFVDPDGKKGEICSRIPANETTQVERLLAPSPKLPL